MNVKQGGTDIPETGYQWTCPYCGQSRINRGADDSGREHAVAALQRHIIATDGGGHAPRYESSAVEPLTLSEFVLRVNGQQQV